MRRTTRPLLKRLWIVAMVGVVIAGLFLIPDTRDADAAAAINWSGNTAGTKPLVTTWDNTVVMNREYTRIYELRIREMTGADVTVENIEAMVSGNITLDTEWMFTVDARVVGSQSGLDPGNQDSSEGYGNFVSASAFLANGGIRVYAEGSDQYVDITVTARGTNPFDFGMDSDSTATPLKATYTGRLNLRAIGFL